MEMSLLLKVSKRPVKITFTKLKHIPKVRRRLAEQKHTNAQAPAPACVAIPAL